MITFDEVNKKWVAYLEQKKLRNVLNSNFQWENITWCGFSNLVDGYRLEGEYEGKILEVDFDGGYSTVDLEWKELEKEESKHLISLLEGYNGFYKVEFYRDLRNAHASFKLKEKQKIVGLTVEKVYYDEKFDRFVTRYSNGIETNEDNI